MTRRSLLGSLATPFFAAAQAPARKPNIIVIVADDLGWASIGVQGSKDIPTPNIDQLAKTGARFTDGYVSCPVCSPTRAGLMTGRYQQRFGHEFNPGPALQSADNFGLPLNQATMADFMRLSGLRTGMVGKWHLGYKPEYHPLKRGFQEFFGFLGGAHSYVDAQADSANMILRGREPYQEEEYLTHAFTREACAFIDRQKASPFFLYLTYNAVHAPMQGAEKYMKQFAHLTDTRRRTFAAMLTALDEGVGQILARLREHKIEEQTMIFFISDNGGPTAQTTSSNLPLRGVKGQTYEGGIRVPFLVNWKGKIPAGQVLKQPVIALDILPTALDALGMKAPAIYDGVSLMPLLTSGQGTPHDKLFWRFGPRRAIRKGSWKMVQDQGGQPELYDLAADVGEAKNLAAAQPEKLKELLADYEAWNAQLMPAAWNTQREREGQKKKKKKAA